MPILLTTVLNILRRDSIYSEEERSVHHAQYNATCDLCCPLQAVRITSPLMNNKFPAWRPLYLNCLLYLSGTKTSGAHIYSSDTVVSHSFDPLQVGHKHPLRFVVRMTDIISGHFFLSAH